MIDAVQVAAPELDAAWLTLAMLALTTFCATTVKRSEFLETASDMAISAGADEDLVAEYLDEALSQLAEANRLVLSGAEITVLVRP